MSLRFLTRMCHAYAITVNWSSHTMPTAMVAMTNIFQSCLQSQLWLILRGLNQYNATKIDISTSWLTLIFTRTTLCSPKVKHSPIMQGQLYAFLWSNPLQFHSLHVILIFFFFNFPSPNSVFTKLGQFTFCYSLTHLFLFTNYKQFFTLSVHCC